MITLDQARTIIATEKFMAPYNLQIESLGDGECTLRVPYRAEYARPGGVVAGPVYMSVADAAMWFALMTRVDDGHMSLTVTLDTLFLSGAREEDILCTARVLKVGRRMIYGTAECHTLDGRPLTHHTITYMRPTP